MRPKALWIEDSAQLELANLTGPVFFNRNCHLTLAEDVTTAVNLLSTDRFEAMVVDIRLPPGRDGRWGDQYRRSGSDKVSAQLGLKLLQWLLGGDRTIMPDDPPSWVTPQQFGVFTVESRGEIQRYLDPLGIKVFQEKNAAISDNTLDELIGRLLAQQPEAG
jgi:hypothetical protein